MKHLTFLLFAVLIGVSPVLAQYPSYQWINPHEREEIGRKVVYSQAFGQSQSFAIEGRNQCVITPTAGGLQIVSQGNDPYFWTVPLSVQGGPITGMVECSLTMKSDCGANGQIFWSEDIRDGFDENRSVRFDVTNDGQFYTYTARALLDGQLRKVRIDPGTDKGSAVISKFEIDLIERSPIEITNMVSHNEKFTIEITNHSEKQVFISEASLRVQNRTIAGKSSIQLEKVFPRKEPFESLEFNILLQGSEKHLTRTVYAFHENRETEWFEAKGESFTAFIARDGSGAKIVKDGKTIGVIMPFSTGVLVTDPPSSFKVVGREIHFDFTHKEDFSGPVFRPLGTMEQAVLSGVEYLEKGEHSSSKADHETAAHLRFSPDPLKMTMPFMGIITDRCSFGLLWDNPLNTRVQFATPDFLEGKQPGDPLQNRMGLFGAKVKGVLRIGPAYNEETIEDAILWAVNKRGVPPLPPAPRSLEAQQKLNLAGLMESELYKDGKWAHAIIPGMTLFPYTNSADCASTVWQLTGKLPDGSRDYARGGAHLENPSVYFLTGSAQRWLDMINNDANGIRRSQQADGSFLYNGKYLKGHWDNKASGHCGEKVYRLYEHYRYTGNEESLAAALKGTDFLNTFRVPRGAQTWELSLHTPDIMGSAWCCLANVRAFEATGKDEYLQQAKRWAISGLPFVYQWETPLAGKDKPVMLYATTPVLGATDWVAPDWIGLPVQWCGLDYAEALFLLAPHDPTFDWQTIAEGILIAGEQMQYEKEPSIGLLPDSWTMKSQNPNPADINPVVLERLRRRAKGELAALDVQISPDGKTRVVAPLPIRFDGNTPVIDALEGIEVQILVNGKVSQAASLAR